MESTGSAIDIVSVDERESDNADDLHWKDKDIDDVRWESDDECEEDIDKENKDEVGENVEDGNLKADDNDDVKLESDEETEENIVEKGTENKKEYAVADEVEWTVDDVEWESDEGAEEINEEKDQPKDSESEQGGDGREDVTEDITADGRKSSFEETVENISRIEREKDTEDGLVGVPEKIIESGEGESDAAKVVELRISDDKKGMTVEVESTKDGRGLQDNNVERGNEYSQDVDKGQCDGDVNLQKENTTVSVEENLGNIDYVREEINITENIEETETNKDIDNAIEGSKLNDNGISTNETDYSQVLVSKENEKDIDTTIEPTPSNFSTNIMVSDRSEDNALEVNQPEIVLYEPNAPEPSVIIPGGNLSSPDSSTKSAENIVNEPQTSLPAQDSSVSEGKSVLLPKVEPKEFQSETKKKKKNKKNKKKNKEETLDGVGKVIAPSNGTSERAVGDVKGGATVTQKMSTDQVFVDTVKGEFLRNIPPSSDFVTEIPPSSDFMTEIPPSSEFVTENPPSSDLVLSEWITSETSSMDVNPVDNSVDINVDHPCEEYPSVDHVNVFMEAISDYQNEALPVVFVDRHEEMMAHSSAPTVSRHLYEDVVRNKARAERLISQNPEAGQRQIVKDSTSEVAALTPAGHLMTEMTLLETSARDQWESLHYADFQLDRYEAEIQELTDAINEAQRKLQASPSMATSVGALKQQMADRNNLTEKIKEWQIKVNEISEKNRQLRLDIAQLSPSVFRKHYHPESAYWDYFSAIAQHKRGTSPLPVYGNLFYESLPVYDLPDGQDSLLGSTIDHKQTLQSWPPGWHHATSHGATPISLELPRLIPPPRTDSIPRPTWSGYILSSSASSSDYSRGTSTSHSLEGSRTMAQTFETSASFAGSVGSALASAARYEEPNISTITAEAGPHISRSRGVSSAESASWDSGLGTDGNELSSSMSQLHTNDPSVSIASVAAKLRTASGSPPKQAPIGGRPTEILRMHGFGDTDSVDGGTSTNLRRLSYNKNGSIDNNLASDGTTSFEAASPSLVANMAKGTTKDVSSLEVGAEISSEEQNPRRDQENPLITSEHIGQVKAPATDMEIRAALQKQEIYRQAVKDLAAKLQQADIRLATNSTSDTSFEAKTGEYQELLTQMQSIKDEIARVKDLRDQLCDTPGSEDHKDLDAMLTMLTGRYCNLEVLADDIGKQLEGAIQKQIEDHYGWLEETKIQMSSTVPSEDLPRLEAQLNENQKIQAQIRSRLQQISDLELQCDKLENMESPATTDKLRKDLTVLQGDLKQLESDTVWKCDHLQAAVLAVKEAEQGLQNWMSDTRDLTTPSTNQTITLSPEQELAEDIRRHKLLVTQITGHGRHLLPASAEAKTSGKDIRANWERLSIDITQKKQNLESILRTLKPGELGKLSLNATAHYAESKQLEEVKNAIADLSDTWSLLQGKHQKTRLQSEQNLVFQQQYQKVLEDVSNWLDGAEQQLLTLPFATEEQNSQNKNLQEQIKSLEGEITMMNKQAEDLLATTNSDNKELIVKCVTCMNERVKLIKNTALKQADRLHQTENQWKQYKGEVAKLQGQLQDTQQLILTPTSTQSLDQLVSDSQKIEAQLKKCETALDELRQKESSLTQGYPKGLFSSGLPSLQSKYVELNKKAAERKSAVQNLVIVQDQYQRMIKDITSFLETAQDKLQAEPISARDLNDLKQQLLIHNDFFSDLEVHKAMMDSLASNCDPSTRSHLQQQHSNLSSSVLVLVDQASLHGQRLERLTRQWAELEEKYVILQEVMSSLESQLPQPVVSEDSLLTIQDKQNKYKRLQLELADKRDSVFEVVEKGRQILHSINCPVLETAITELANKWVSLHTDITNELKRTEYLGDQLSVFGTEFDVLSSWLVTAKMKLASFKLLSPSTLYNIATVRVEVEKVLEFHNEVENQLPLKNRVISVGKQLIQTKSSDIRDLADKLRTLEEEWAQLETGIVETQQYLFEVQMELMPSRQTLNELTTRLEEISKSLEKDASMRTRTVPDIRAMVKKYKAYKIELASRRISLDFISQQVLLPQPGEQGVSNEKQEFADKLEELNKQWKRVTTEVDDRLNEMEGENSKWEEYETASERLQAWFQVQEDTVKRFKLIGSKVGVQQVLKECEALQQQLEAKTMELAAIKALGTYLIKLDPKNQQLINGRLSSLDQNWKKLHEQATQLQKLLVDTSDLWAQYDLDLTELNQVLMQTEYALNNHTQIRGDITTLRSHVAKLKNLQSDLDKSSGHLDTFLLVGGQLRQICEPQVQVDIQKTVSDIQTKWRRLTLELTARCNEFEQHFNEWQQFESQYSKVQGWLDTKEALCTDLTNLDIDSQKRQESLTKCKQLQRELDSFQTEIENLNRMSNKLMKNMNPSTVSIMMSRQLAVEQKMHTLRQILSQFLVTLSNDLSKFEKFSEAFEIVNKFLASAEDILIHEDPTKAAEMEAILHRQERLKELLVLFSTNFNKLDTVNDLGYRLALNEIDATRLRELNHKWYRLYEDTRDRSRTLQSHLLQQQDFTAKCETWMKFLTQAEQNLAEEMKGDLRNLFDQLRKCEQIESDMHSSQQVLRRIISEGQKMIMAGEVEDKDDFQRKLHLLSDQWQSVSRRVSQRKATIEEITSNWQEFKTLSQQLREWLKENQDALTTYDSGSQSLQVIRNLGEKIQAIKQQFTLKETTLKKVEDLGNSLLQHADDCSAKEIKDTISDIQQKWHKVLIMLDKKRSQLEGVDHKWQECESQIDGMMGELKNISSILNTDIPTTYDALETDMNRCRDIENEFIRSENRERDLQEKEKQLGRMVETDDMNLLHHRIQIVNRQRKELQHQTHVREDKITDAIFRRTNIGDCLQSLIDWIEDMTIKVLSNKDMQVEDLLAKLENEYMKEVEDKEFQKAMLVEDCQQIMQISSSNRASAIRQKLHNLEDKWHNLKKVLDFRTRKLRETVSAVKQLDSSMKNLGCWLSAVENELSEGIMFKDSSLREMQAKLQDSQELQQDIERHRPGVDAVLNLCEVLLHDSDACPTDAEFMALQDAGRNLEKRWRNICAVSPQRKIRVQETWHLWDTFRDECKRFSEWLTQAEQDVGDSEIEVPNVKAAKASIKRYEELQRNIHDHLSDLDHLNRQYCQLAKKGLADTDDSRKAMMIELNNRWDDLQLRVTEIMKKLLHSSSIRKDFETTRSSLITWLTEVDAQLIKLQHPTSHDLPNKIIEIQRIEDEIHTRRHRMKYLDQAGVYLMQKGDSQEALRVQRELDEFRTLCRTVLGRVGTTKLRMEQMVVAQSEDISTKFGSESRYYETAADHRRNLVSLQAKYELDKKTAELERLLEESPPESLPYISRSDASRHQGSLSPSRITISVTHRAGSPRQRSKSPSPVRSRSLRRKSLTPTRSVSPQRRLSPSTKSPSRFSSDVTDGHGQQRHDISYLEKSAKIAVLMEQLVESLEDCNIKLLRLEKAIANGTERSTHSLMDCEAAVDNVQRLDRLLKTETGLTIIDSVDAQVKFVLRRWENLHKQAKECDNRLYEKQHQWAYEIESMLAWLDEAEAFQSAHRYLPSDNTQLDRVIRQYEDFLTLVDSKMHTVLSINQQSETYLRTQSPKTRELKGKLHEMNRRWELIQSWAGDIRSHLQQPLTEHQEFLQTTDDYQLWLENIEARIRHCEPVSLNADESSLLEKYSQLMDIHAELEDKLAEVLTLKETADRLLVTTNSSDMSTARDKMYIVHKRMQSLMPRTSAYISSLENKLKTSLHRGTASASFNVSERRSSGLGSSHPSSSSMPLLSGPVITKTRSRSPFAAPRWLLSGITQPLLGSRTKDNENLSTELETSAAGTQHSKSQARPALLMRVIRAALPFQLLLLLLCLLFCLIPVCEDEYSCMFSNNLRHSMSPMLQYTDGAPPV